MYLKNGVTYSTFFDKSCNVKIVRGEIVEVSKLSTLMKRRIRAKGLIECTKEEYLEYKKLSAVSAAPEGSEPSVVGAEEANAGKEEDGKEVTASEPEKTDADKADVVDEEGQPVQKKGRGWKKLKKP